jgi:hypothetical protein
MIQYTKSLEHDKKLYFQDSSYKLNQIKISYKSFIMVVSSLFNNAKLWIVQALFTVGPLRTIYFRLSNMRLFNKSCARILQHKLRTHYEVTAQYVL